MNSLLNLLLVVVLFQCISSSYGMDDDEHVHTIPMANCLQSQCYNYCVARDSLYGSKYTIF